MNGQCALRGELKQALVRLVPPSLSIYSKKDLGISTTLISKTRMCVTHNATTLLRFSLYIS